MQANGQLHASAALAVEKEFPILTGQEAGGP